MTNGKDKAPKDKWDKIEILTKFLPAIVVAIIAILGNYYLQNKQKADTNLKLYTQLLANKENSENTLRKDMFFEMLKSFLSPEKGGANSQVESVEQALTKIREKRFSLELLARNFHESLDMKPLFKHVLMEIVWPRIKLRRQDYELSRTIGSFELLYAFETISNGKYDNEKKDKLIKKIIQKYYSDRPLANKEIQLTKSLDRFGIKVKIPGADIEEERVGIVHDLVNMIDKDKLRAEFGKIYKRLNIPEKNFSENIEKIKYLSFFGNSRDEIENMLDTINQRSEKPTVIKLKEDEIKRHLYTIDESLSKNEIQVEDAILLYDHLIPMLKPQQNMIRRTLSQYDRELDRLITIAKRVTRKQREVLEDVSGKLSLRIPLQGDLSERICQNVRPNERIPDNGKCPNSDSSAAWETKGSEQGVKFDGELFYLDSEGKKDDQSKRYFLIKVRYVYPKWKQVYVQIENSPNKAKHEEWVAAKNNFIKTQTDNQVAFLNQNKDGLKIRLEKLRTKYKIDRKTFNTMIDNNFEIYFKRFLKDYYGIEESAFWLEYFDFPLVDNSYINSKQRYSMVLEGFNPGWDGEDESVDITLLYYPASYAGLKEKSFYNNQLMNTLTKEGFFSGAKKSGEALNDFIISGGGY